MPLTIEAIKILDTNYVWAMHNDHHALLVDPGEAETPLRWLEDRRLTLSALLITHHHGDHTNGIDGILERHDIPVWGPDDQRIPQVDRPVHDGEQIKLNAPELNLEVLSIPGHTSIHLAFFGDGMVMCGDQLFSAGCGRLFEGTPEQMLASLDRLAALPDDTRMYCGHEYTAANCRFALEVEPDNPDLQARAAEARRIQRSGGITLPSTIGAEHRFNPFLRVREPAVIAAVQKHEPDCDSDPVSVFAALRRWKDSF